MMIKVVKANTKLGQRLVAQGQNYEGKYLNQVYDSYSKAKLDAWNNCFEQCCEEKGEEFSIVSHNSFCFCVSWFTSQGMRYITPNNSYLVVFE